MKNTAILLIECPDQKGLDATIADFIFRHDGNILHFEQHQAGEERFYLARVEWDLSDFKLKTGTFCCPTSARLRRNFQCTGDSLFPVIGRALPFLFLNSTIAWWISFTGNATGSLLAKFP